MRHLLHAVLARIGDRAVAIARHHPQHLADLGRGAVEIDDLLGTGRSGEMVKCHIGAFRDNQHMHGCGRVDVMEGQRVGGFQNRLVGDFAAQDAGKDVLRIVAMGHRSVHI